MVSNFPSPAFVNWSALANAYAQIQAACVSEHSVSPPVLLRSQNFAQRAWLSWVRTLLSRHHYELDPLILSSSGLCGVGSNGLAISVSL